MRRPTAIILVLIVVLIWGSVAPIAKLMMAGIDFLTLQGTMCALSALSLLVVLAVQRKIGALRSLRAKDHLQHLGLGALGIFLYGACFFGAISIMPVQEATVLNYVWPLFAMLLAVPLLKERLRLSALGAALLAFVGVVIVVTQGDPFAHPPSSMLGIGLMIVSGVSYALYSLIGKRMTIDPVVAVFLHCLYAAPMFLVAAHFLGARADITLFGWLTLLYLGPVTIGLAYLLWLTALRSLETRVAGTLIYLAPFVSLVFIALLVGEPIHPASWAGLILIIAGAAWQLWQPQKAPIHPINVEGAEKEAPMPPQS
jgi:drug/metabolite transporter (DMT)-like permease